MRIVNRKHFLNLSAGILYRKIDSMVFEELCMKGDSSGSNDFLYQSLNHIKSTGDVDLYAKLEDAITNDTSLELDLNYMRKDGCFNDNQLFEILEKQDVEKLSRLFAEVAAAYPDTSGEL